MWCGENHDKWVPLSKLYHSDWLIRKLNRDMCWPSPLLPGQNLEDKYFVPCVDYQEDDGIYRYGKCPGLRECFLRNPLAAVSCASVHGIRSGYPCRLCTNGIGGKPLPNRNYIIRQTIE